MTTVMAAAALHYRVSFARAAARYLDVQLTLPAASAMLHPCNSPWQLSMAAWIPGSYLIRDFAKNIHGMTAHTQSGAPVALTLIDQQTWSVPRCDSDLVLNYTIYCADFSVRTAHVDLSHAFFNGTSAFLRVHGLELQPCALWLLDDGAPSSWQVATSCPPINVDGRGFGQYAAANFEALIDYPVELGQFHAVRWDVGGVPHRMVFTHAHPKTDFERIARDVAKICGVEIAFFGAAPFAQYLFLVALDDSGFGGLEHRDSTALIFPRNDLPLSGERGVTPAYQRFLSLCAHEYFHAWHVKRIRPAAFTQLPLARPAHTRLLWLFEGFTSYFDDWLVRRAGLIDETAYLAALAHTINRAVRGKGWSRQTLEESSFYAWTRFYQQDENAVNVIVSYYTRGAMVALMLDLLLRKAGGSLAHIMRALWRAYGQTPLPEGRVIEGFIARHVPASLDQAALSQFFDYALRTTEPLDFAALLASFGIAVEPVAERGFETNDFGAVVSSDDPRAARVLMVFEDRPAAKAGLVAGDELIALDGFAVSGRNFGELLGRYQVGDTLVVHGFRQSRLLPWTIQLAAPVMNQWRLRLMPDADAGACLFRDQWLAVDEAR